jgi:magnesium transporter
MSRILKKRGKKTGMPPGSLVHVSEIVPQKTRISIIDYDSEHYIEKEDASLEECLIYMNKPSVTWINIQGISDVHLMDTIGSHFGLHALLLEDIMNAGQRCKLDDYTHYLFIVMRLLNYRPNDNNIFDEQVSLILGKNYVISFLETSPTIFETIKNRIRTGNSRIRLMGADNLCYALMDCIVDYYFVILEIVDKQMEDLEEALIYTPGPETMQRIQHLKREIILLRKSVWPMREVINRFRRVESPLVSSAVQLYMHDVYDHTIQAIDTIESFRDIASGMLDVYLSSMSQRMNEVMKVLTVVATIFVPLTFIASIYGMNFDSMPELHWRWGYPLTLFVMATIAVAMLIHFRRKRWI